MNKTIRFWVLGVVAVLAATLVAGGQSDPREKVSIDKISAMLKRVGEPKLAARLKKDFAAGLIRFGELPNDVAADTGKPVTERINKKPNTMTLNKEKVFQQVADNRTPGVNPLELDWAATVLHEYVHMDQVNPVLTSRYETPAWLASSDALRRWLGVFHRDFEKAKKLKDPARARALKELDLLVAQLSSCAGSLGIDLQDKINHKNALGMSEPQVDPKKNYNFGTTRTQAEALLKQIRSLRGVAQPASTKTKFSWVRKEGGFRLNYGEDVIAPYRTNNGYTISGAEGVVTFGYRAGAETCRFAVTWNRPPDRLAPGETYRMTLKAADTGSSAAVGGAGGSVAVFVQRSTNGAWELAYGNQPMVAVKGREAPAERDYVFAIPEGKPGQILVIKVSIWDTLVGSEYNVSYVCE